MTEWYAFMLGGIFMVYNSVKGFLNGFFFFSNKIVKLWKVSVRQRMSTPSLFVSQIEYPFFPLSFLAPLLGGKGGVGDEVTVPKHGPDPCTNTTFPLPWIQVKAEQTKALFINDTSEFLCWDDRKLVLKASQVSHQPEGEKYLNTNLFCTRLVLLLVEEGHL